MPFLPIILDFDIILGTCLSKISQNTCFKAKVTLKKKAPARKPANSRPVWGCTPDGPFFKIWELANSKLLLIKFHLISKNP